jgi:hypothetical protein
LRISTAASLRSAPGFASSISPAFFLPRAEIEGQRDLARKDYHRWRVVRDRHRTAVVGLEYGTSPTYTLKRLKRDRPDLADKVVRGELSANARRSKPASARS